MFDPLKTYGIDCNSVGRLRYTGMTPSFWKTSPMKREPKASGFTLIELMGVVLILAAIAFAVASMLMSTQDLDLAMKEHSVAIPGIAAEKEQHHRAPQLPALERADTPATVEEGYVNGLRIDDVTVTLQRHKLNGTLYACMTNMNKCYKVREKM